MNWLVFAVVGFLALSAWDGHRKGFIKKSVRVVSIALTLFLTSSVSSYLMTYLKEKTGLHGVLQHGIASSEITFLLVSVLIQGVVFSLGIVAKLPVLRGLNKTAGMVLGLAEGILCVWIFFFGVTVCMGTKTGGELLWMIADSSLLSWIYRRNLLLLLL